LTVLGIVGGSGSGKSTLARAVRDALGPDRCALLRQDSYYRDLSRLPVADRAATNFDAPAAVELDLLADHLRALARGEAIRPPVYDMATHTRRGEDAAVRPAEHVAIEGLLLAASPPLADAIDVLVFVDLPDEARLARRIARDVSDRGRTEEEVRRRWATDARPMHERWVGPARASADLVARGDAPLAETVAEILGLL
jgi:uridine kinase